MINMLAGGMLTPGVKEIKFTKSDLMTLSCLKTDNIGIGFPAMVLIGII